MRGDIARLGRCTLISTQGEDTIKRSKPFKYAYEKEIVMYIAFFFCCAQYLPTHHSSNAGTLTSKNSTTSRQNASTRQTHTEDTLAHF